MAGSFYALLNRWWGDADRIALSTPEGRRLSYADLDLMAARIAGALADQGAVPGDRVAFQVEKSPEALALYLSCLRAGFVAMPLNPAYQAGEVAYLLGDAEPAVLVADPPRLDSLKPVANAAKVRTVLDLAPDGTGSLTAAAGTAAPLPVAALESSSLAAMLYTSGTTGRPKGAPLSHANIASNAEVLVRAWGFTERDVLLHALPIFHAHGLFVACHCALLSGASMLWLAKFDAHRIMDLLPRSTVLMGVPTFYTRLLADPAFGPATVGGMRLFISGSAPLLAETHREFERRTGQRILERYGMSEILMHTSNPLVGERRPGSVGPVLPGSEVRIVGDDGGVLPAGEVGEVQVRGPNVFSGYWRSPEKTAESFTADGWFRTGDLGTLALDGYLTLVGRAKDLVITGGLNVYPSEIETVIDAVSGVLESAVIGLPHADLGEAVTAVVVPRRPDLDEAAVLAACRDELAGFKRPKRVVIVEELPRNAMGKVQKNLLRDRYKELYAG